MNRKSILATAVLCVGALTLSLSGAANASSTPTVSNTVPLAAGYYYECAVLNTKFSKTIPVLDLHGTYSAAKSACGAGHQIVKVWLGTLPAAAAGPAGPQGPAGATGATGPAGADGKDGKDGTDAQALPYGIALVNVSRGGKPAATWATYSTTIGSPVGDTASGTFRFTCSTANAPCAVSVQAWAPAAGVSVYPRVDISKDDYNTGAAVGNCEYGDGVDNNGSSSAVLSTTQASPSDITLGIGGTLDCGSAQTYPVNGVASEIDVPAGYYDVASTFTFTASK